MVHSGPFNGLCEIESSRGSPGISNIFLPMLQLLRTTPVVAPLLLPQTPASLPPTSRYHPTKAAATHGISQLPAGDPRRMRADFRISTGAKGREFSRDARSERRVVDEARASARREIASCNYRRPFTRECREKKARFLIFYPSSPKFETFFATCTKRREN